MEKQNNQNKIHQFGSDTEQFLRLITANQNRIYACILSMVPNLTQETVSITWRKISKYEPNAKFLSFGKNVNTSKMMFVIPDCWFWSGKEGSGFYPDVNTKY